MQQVDFKVLEVEWSETDTAPVLATAVLLSADLQASKVSPKLGYKHGLDPSHQKNPNSGI